MKFEDYLKIDALSSSAIKLLLKSAAHYKNNNSKISFQSDKMGTAAHALALEGKKTIVRGIDCKRSSKADRASWAEFYKSIGANVDTSESATTWNEECYKQTGIMVGSPDEANAVEMMAKSILTACPEIAKSSVKKEVTEIFEYRGHKTKSRYDAVDYERHIIYDVKTCADASPRGFSSAARKFGYHIQECLYRTNYMENHGAWPEFKFVVVEKVEPYYSAVYTLDENTGFQASCDIDHAIDTYEQCMETGIWPGYQNQELSLFGRHERKGESVENLDDLLV